MIGMQSGITILKKIRKELAPSSCAALIMSLGMPRMNCRMRKIFVAPPPKSEGTNMGYSVFVK